jgi:hypothetical protein
MAKAGARMGHSDHNVGETLREGVDSGPGGVGSETEGWTQGAYEMCVRGSAR